MKQRLVILPIDAIAALLGDYVGEVGFPSDAQPVKWMFHPELRKIALVVEADSLIGNQPDEEIRFTLKRTHLVGA